MAPWLELGPDDTPEGKLRARYIGLEAAAIANGVDPASPDYMNFVTGAQPLVDAAFLAHGLVRAPRQLWGNLDQLTREHVVAALKATRVFKPGQNNWLLFSAMIETALWKYTGECEMKPIEEAVNRHLEWYKGDGVYGDGASPSIGIITTATSSSRCCWTWSDASTRRTTHSARELPRDPRTRPALRHGPGAARLARGDLSRAGPLERIPLRRVPDACADKFAPRAAAGLEARRRTLGDATAVIKRVLEAPGTFDADGWLQIGAVGSQPSIREA